MFCSKSLMSLKRAQEAAAPAGHAATDHGPWVWVSTDMCILHPPLPLPRPAPGALPGTASLWPLEPQRRTARWLRWPWPRGGTSAGQHWRGPLGHGLFLPTPPPGFSVVPCSSAQHSSHTDGWPSV